MFLRGGKFWFILMHYVYGLNVSVLGTTSVMSTPVHPVVTSLAVNYYIHWTTCFDTVFQGLFAVAENLFNILRLIWNVETVCHHLLECLRMMEVEYFAAWTGSCSVMKVEHFAGPIVALANVVKKKFDNGAQELRCFHLPRYTCNYQRIGLMHMRTCTLDNAMMIFIRY